MTADMNLSDTNPISAYFDTYPEATAVPRVKALFQPRVDSANIPSQMFDEYRTTKDVFSVENINHKSFVAFDVSDLSKDIILSKESSYNSFKTYRKLGKFIDLSNYISVSEETIISIEDTTIFLDDTIDKLEAIIDNRAFGLNKFILNLDLNRTLTLQFILSNKVADYYLENQENKSV